MIVYFYLILSILAYILVLYNFTEILNKKRFIQGAILCIIFISLIYDIFQSVFILGIIVFISFLVLLIALNHNVFTNCISCVLSMIYLLICNQIFGRVTLLLIGAKRYAMIGNKPYVRLIVMIIFDIVLFLTSMVIRRYISRNGTELSIVKNRNFKFWAILFGLFLFVGIYTSIHTTEVGIFDVVMYIIGSLFFIILLYLMYTSSIKEEKVARKQLELLQLQTYTENLEYIYNDMRKVRHDYMNVLASMVGYMEERDMDGLIDFFDHNVLAFTHEMKSLDFQLVRLSNIKQRELKGLIAIKIVKAREAGINVSIDIAEQIEITELNPIDICRMIGILLDNAIEAALETKQKTLQLGLLIKKNSKLIIIINSCKEERLNIFQLYQKGYSTKGDNRGLGLSNLKEIISKYSNCDMETVVENYEFKQIMEIRPC
ncbi:sensor histidine kinase [Anaeromicropila herbilytica]|uniref:ATPase n=1 Tax=Anaeromicropila herbilytica TaxID=2785025 RepID=A0A7R7EJL1_9FIRM|nr:GHKL domain-containing protein [Anaeromicropila herbilytica]BCN29885.1 ATPase [Anaeromicropila herbilytica]